MVTNLGHISGGHFNPAITLGFVVTRRIKPALAAVYWFSQLLGAVCAAFLLRYLFTQARGQGDRAGSGRDITDGKAFLLEAIMTFFLVWAVWATAVDRARSIQGDRRPCDRPDDHRSTSSSAAR